MTSLIFPKLIRSAARDGILTYLSLLPAPGRAVVLTLDTTKPVPLQVKQGLPANPD
jgi:hypothetical protein